MIKKKLTLCVLLVFLVFLGWWLLFRFIPNKDNVNLSEIQLVSNINEIARKNTKDIFASCEILTVQEKLQVARSNYEFFETMKASERIIYLGGGYGINQNLVPAQIYGIFESWLFVQNKKLPYDIIAISWTYTSGGIDNTNGQITTITKPEFDEIYNDTDIKGFTKEQAAKALADKWIQKTGYVKK